MTSQSQPVLPSNGQPSAEPSAAEERLSWWWSRDDEHFYGPHHSKADAIMDAWGDDPDQGAYVCRAASGEWRTDIIDEGVIADAFDDVNEESANPEGDPPSTIMDPADWKKLADRLNKTVRAAIREKGLTAWAFAQQYPSDWVDIAAMWKAATLADADTTDRLPSPREAI